MRFQPGLSSPYGLLSQLRNVLLNTGKRHGERVLLNFLMGKEKS